MSKLERLQKAVVDTAADYDDDKAAFDYSFNKAEDDDDAADAAYVIYKAATYVAWSNAERDLNNYLKEQDK
jgi:hypothetical protein